MQLETLKTFEEFSKLATEWNDLLRRCASHVPFLRHEYLSSWWRTLGGGEWEKGDLHIVTARAIDNKLVGAAPLFFTKNLDDQPALMFLGSIEISDYLDILSPNETLPVFIDLLLEHLDSRIDQNWQVLDLYNLLEDSATLPILKAATRNRGWHYTQKRIQPAPVVVLPKSWDDYLGGIQKKQRHEIRRKRRRAEGYFLPVQWYIVEEEATLDDEIDAFLKLMAHDRHKDAFLTRLMRAQMRDSIHSAFQADWLQLAFLEVGSEKAAGYLNFDYDNHIWVYNSGINYNFNKLSPGWVLLANIIEWGIENGRKTLDFMRGDEAYKYRFGGVDRHVVRVRIERK